MTTGSSTFMGLGMGLNGEYEMTQQVAATDIFTLTGASSQSGDFFVGRTSAGTERVWINADGCFYSRGATVTATAYLGVDARGAVDAAATGTFFSTGGFRITSALATVEACQQYALNLDFRHTGTNPGGRNAALNIRYTYTAGSAPDTAVGFINFEDVNGTTPTLFTIANATNGFWQTAGSTPTCTHLLTFYVHTTKYYLMVAAQSSA